MLTSVQQKIIVGENCSELETLKIWFKKLQQIVMNYSCFLQLKHYTLNLKPHLFVLLLRAVIKCCARLSVKCGEAKG